MPNWCSNTLILEHDDPEMIKRVETAFAEGKLLNEFIPVPEDLQITAGWLGNSDEQKQLDLNEQANLDKHGYKNWYDFCVGEWGTKWDVGEADGINEVTENSITVYFDSAWAPPVEAYNKLTDLGFRVDAMYHEPGMCFAGIYKDGDDDCYDLNGLNIEQVRAELPHSLDQAFGIIEMMEEWAAENEDEE
jgi:hypothetical protein